MRRILLFVFIIVFCSLQPAWAASDTNVMDDIGFDKSYGYYSSANETINMQTGNVILSIPVSPLYPGPEGSGLGLQLKAIYNSSSWRYKANDVTLYYQPPDPDNPINLHALVDFEKMYFSPLGFGWRLHMGRLFRKKVEFGDVCECWQYFYEDPSGAMHEFGPYCQEDPVQGGYGTFTYNSMDASDLRLQVKDYLQDTQKIILFDGSGKTYHFDGPVLKAPMIPNSCYGAGEINEICPTSDKVMYVTDIYNYNKAAHISITYHTDHTEFFENPIPEHGYLYYEHIIKKIEDPFGRILNFNYENTTEEEVIHFPRLTSITAPGFSGKTIEYLFNVQSGVSIYEPWGEADCKYPEPSTKENNYFDGPVVLQGQLVLNSITLPKEGEIPSHIYTHTFGYGAENKGAIMHYTDPLGATTSYYFRDLITITSSKMSFNVGVPPVLMPYNYDRYQPSRFIYKKSVNHENPESGYYQDHEWLYAIETNHKQFDPYSAGVYSNESYIEIDQGFSSYGNTLPMTRVKDPEGNETVYLWKDVEYSCGELEPGEWDQDPYRPKWETVPDCPEEDNSYNGRLTSILYFEGNAAEEHLRKTEIFNNGYPEGQTFGEEYPVSPAPEFDMYCHDNQKVHQANIRQLSKITKIYEPGEGVDQIGDCVTTEEIFTYDDQNYGTITLSTVVTDGFQNQNITTDREYIQDDRFIYWDSEDPENSRYKVDFVKSVEIREGGDLVSKTVFEPDTQPDPDNPESEVTTGRISAIDLFTDPGSSVMMESFYDGEYYEKNREVWYGALSPTGEVGRDLIYYFTYEYGNLSRKHMIRDIGGGNTEELNLVHKMIDGNTGLVRESYDAAGNCTTYIYDNLSRMTWIDPPGSDRYTTTISYRDDELDDDEWGKGFETVRYWKTDGQGFSVQYQTFKLDGLGNVVSQKTRIYDESGYHLITMQQSLFDWCGKKIFSIYPGHPEDNPDTTVDLEQERRRIWSQFDCLGRSFGTFHEDTGTFTSSIYLLDDETPGFTKNSVTDAMGITRDHYSDLRGNLRKVHVPDDIITSGNAEYKYDARGNLTDVERNGDENSERTFRYDFLDRLVESNEPETGSRYSYYYRDGRIMGESTENIPSFNPNQYESHPDRTKYYSYDDFNRLTHVAHNIEGNKVVIRKLNYDQTEVVFNEGSQNALTVYLNNGKGKLTSRKDYNYSGADLVGETHIARSYSAHGNITTEWMLVKSSGSFESDLYQTVYTYNKWGNLSDIQYPVSKLRVKYGNENRVNGGYGGDAVTHVQIEESGSLRSIAKDVYYSPTGNFKQINYDNNASQYLVPDKRNRYQYVGALYNGTNAYFADEYEYNPVDQIKYIKDLTSNPVTGKHYYYYSDGSLDCVKDVPDMASPGTETMRVNYEYDNFGNMTRREVAGKPGMSFQGIPYDSGNQITSTFWYGGSAYNRFWYDSNGNVTINPLTEHEYVFDYDNRLMEVSNTEPYPHKYIYDGDNRRRLHFVGDSVEMSFYDQSGNSLIEKVTYNIGGDGTPDLVKDECFINLGKNNIAQFNNLEPVLTIELDKTKPNKSVFYPDETFMINLEYEFMGQPLDVNLYAFLEYANTYYYFPTWTATLDFKSIELVHGHGSEEIFPEIVLEPSQKDINGLRFWAAMVAPDIDGKDRVFGNIAVKEFSLKSSNNNYYAKPGSIPGNGSLELPFNSIQAAIDHVIASPPSNGERAVIKLFPGIYELTGDDETITINQSGIDLIGSGQNRTILQGTSHWSSIVLDNGADSVIQGMRLECNIFCTNAATPFIRDVRIINNNALAGIIAENGCELNVVNCLIADYYFGILLNNSSCTIRHCTIDNCWGCDDPTELPDDWPDDWPEVFAGGGIVGSCSDGSTYIDVYESIITDNELGVSISGNVAVTVSHTDVFGNDEDISGPLSQFDLTDNNISSDPLFVPGLDHGYYLSAVSAGQSQDSPCIDAGFASMDLTQIVGGTTRTDGIFDICISDIGYHGRLFNELVGIGNINNDDYEDDDPLKAISIADKTDLDAKSVTVKDKDSLFSNGPKDILIIKVNADGSREFQSFFQNNCSLQQQTNPDSPKSLLDASLSDLDGDGVLDLVVLEESGLTLFVNDTAGVMLYDSAKSKSRSKAIETLDFNNDGKMDLLIATETGVSVQIADDHLVYSDFQTLNSGDTEDLVLYDFNGDGDSDLTTIDSSGIVRFYENNRTYGFREVGEPAHVNGYGKLMIQDTNNDGQMDVVVEIEPGVEEVVKVGSTFGIQYIPPSGKRAVRYALFDHLGSAKMLINDQCEVVWPKTGSVEANEMLPFGKDLDFDPDNPDPVEAAYKLTFTNKEIDHVLDLHYFGSRYYHATLPRFISPDPVSGKLGIPLSWNPYLYCRNDPVNYFDPEGNDQVYFMFLDLDEGQFKEMYAATKGARDAAVSIVGEREVTVSPFATNREIKMALSDPEAQMLFIFSHGGDSTISSSSGLEDPEAFTWYRDFSETSDSMKYMYLGWCDSGSNGSHFEKNAKKKNPNVEVRVFDYKVPYLEMALDMLLNGSDIVFETLPILEDPYADPNTDSE